MQEEGVFNGVSVPIPADVFSEVLAGGDFSRCLAELEEVPVSTLWPRSSTLRALASLLTADDLRVNKAAAGYLSSGASRSHFKARVRRLCVLAASRPRGADRRGLTLAWVFFSFSPRWAAGGGALHPGAVGGRRSEPEGRLLGSQLPAGQWPCRSHYRLTCPLPRPRSGGF